MFEKIPPELLLVVTSVGAVVMGILVMVIRTKAAKKPATVKKIVLPPLFMSTGALMFIFPFFRVHPMQIFEALVVGMLFSTVLIWSSKFEIRDGDIYLKQSKAFIFILIGLLIVRLVGKIVLSSTVDVGELGGMFWILAFGMIVPWRAAMYLQFKKLADKTKSAIPN
jgi:membrane protein CcdC involved in cytochrome C biogenesis